jgi:hypothetical protein
MPKRWPRPLPHPRLGQHGADSYISYAVGRTGDMFKTSDYRISPFELFKASDYRISPFELQSALLEHHAIAEATGAPSPYPIRPAVPRLSSPWPPVTSRTGTPPCRSSSTPAVTCPLVARSAHMALHAVRL